MSDLTTHAGNPSDASSNATPAASSPLPDRGGAIYALRVFAWLDLVAGAIGAIVIWANFGSVEVPIYGTITKTQANPIGIGLGIALLVQGIFLCAFFLVVAGAAEDIAAIRKKGAS